jgi:ribonuclease D
MSLPSPHWVADATRLKTVVQTLTHEPAVAVDTESNSLYAYREQVCLIQISIPGQDYLIDPLAFPDLAALAPLFANPRQQKIFHAAEYDVLCLKRDYGFEFANLFDTMAAARTLGWPQVGLAALLEKYFGVKMNKKHQRADWGRRPLTREQLDYARLDVHYLQALRDMLQAELMAAGCLEEAQEEFVRLARLKAEPPAVNQNQFWHLNGARDLKPAQAAVLRELYYYRERQAERANRPPFKILSEQTLMEIAQQCPHTPADLRGLSGMTPGQMERHAHALLQAVQNGLAAVPPHPPRQMREADDVRERYDRLHLWRKRRAQARGVESDVILPRDTLWELARRVPRTPADLLTIETLGPWRRATYGAELLKVLNEAQS